MAIYHLFSDADLEPFTHTDAVDRVQAVRIFGARLGQRLTLKPPSSDPLAIYLMRETDPLGAPLFVSKPDISVYKAED